MNQNYATKINAEIPDCDSDISPIAQLLSSIETGLAISHDAVSALETRVSPIRACCPEDEAKQLPREPAQTDMERVLQNIYDTVKHLNSRIRKTESELRI